MSVSICFPGALAGGRPGLELRLALMGCARPCDLLTRAMDARCQAALDDLAAELVAALLRRPAALTAAATDCRREVLRAVRAAYGDGAPGWRLTDDSQTQALLPLIGWGARVASQYHRSVSTGCGQRGSDRADRAAYAALRLWERAEDVSLWAHTSRGVSTKTGVDLGRCFDLYEKAESHAGAPFFFVERTVRLRALDGAAADTSLPPSLERTAQ